MRAKAAASVLLGLAGLLSMGAALSPGPSPISKSDGISGVVGPGGPCAEFNGFRHLKFEEEFKQSFVEADTGAAGPFVDGTTDAEWEQSGVVVTPVGVPLEAFFGSGGTDMAGNFLIAPGSVGDTGFNFRFATPGTCILPAGGGRCHPLDVPIVNMGQYGGHVLCWVVRLGIYDSSDTGSGGAAGWDSAFAIGMSETDTSLMVPSTGALTNWGSTNEGFMFHLTRAGNLEFVVNHSGSKTIPSGASVALKTTIDAYNTGEQPTFIDMGVIIKQTDTNAPSFTDVDKGTIQAYYRLVNVIDQPTNWIKLGSLLSGDDVLPFHGSGAFGFTNYTILEVQQSATDAQARPEFGLEFFLSHIMGYYSREEYLEAQ